MKQFFFITLSILIFLPNTATKAQQNPRGLELVWQTEKSKHLVPLDEFTALMQRDGILFIDHPKFWDKEKALKELFVHEPVIAVEIDGIAKAYPLSILMFHEIVNDEIDGHFFSATYCPLCNAALVFDRRLSYGDTTYLLDFGVSGMLRMSDLVMWDRQTETWWQQFTGEALVGQLSGAELKRIPSLTISLEEFLQAYPTGQVLSNETGHFRVYGTNPYAAYDDVDNTPRFFKGTIDDRLPAMERVIDIHVGGKYKVYPLSIIQEKQVINDHFQGEDVVLFYTSKTVSVLDESIIADSRKIGSVTVFSPVIEGQTLRFHKEAEHFIDELSHSVWNIAGQCIEGPYKGKQLNPKAHGNHFAFAWFAFRPESEVFEK
jgi:hypothetical protein